jgi:hypothetical protein
MRELTMAARTVAGDFASMAYVAVLSLLVYLASMAWSDPSWILFWSVAAGCYTGSVLAEVRNRAVRRRRLKDGPAAASFADFYADRVSAVIKPSPAVGVVTADEFAFDRAKGFGDETADGLFRTVESRPSDGLAKGVLADRLDEVGEKWKWVSYAFRWCMKNDKFPYRTSNGGEWWWHASDHRKWTVLPPGLFATTGESVLISYPTQLAAYLGLAEAIRRLHEEVAL